MSNVYVGASYPRKADAKLLAEIIASHGHIITSTWVTEDEGYNNDSRPHEGEYQKCQRLGTAAVRDLKQVMSSDVGVFYTDGEDQLTHGGRHSEMGALLALSKTVIIIGPKEQVFHYHRAVRVYDDLSSFVQVIKDVL